MREYDHRRLLAEVALKLIHDYRKNVPVSGNARCRVRVYLPDAEGDAPVVLITEPEFNPGSPVLDGVNSLAADIFREHSEALIPAPAPVFVQHNETRDSFYLLVFPSPHAIKSPTQKDPMLTLGSPRWKSLDRPTVEFLLGGAA